jgi:hypothetical protein
MKKRIKRRVRVKHYRRNILIAGLLATLGTVLASASTNEETIGELNQSQNKPEFNPGLFSGKPLKDKIQIAIILDTSNSMDGLIDQTRNQLWQVVNDFSSARRNGRPPVLEIALLEYGNDNNFVQSGFIRKLNGFTRELDQVSAGLFSLTTNGGSEYGGFAIETAVTNLNWSQTDSDLKSIFIAGNESFRQGPVNFQQAIIRARKQGIIINTIHAGDYQAGITDGWQSAALLAGGAFMSIDANRQVGHISAPQDAKITELNSQLNNTYLPFGREGKSKASRQLEQDVLSSNVSSGLLAKRAISKSSSYYDNAQWDLVDAVQEGSVNEQSLTDMEDSLLPESMIALDTKERLQFIIEKSRERKNIRQQIKELSKARSAYVASKQGVGQSIIPDISKAVTSAVRNRAIQKDYIFE